MIRLAGGVGFLWALLHVDTATTLSSQLVVLFIAVIAGACFLAVD